jgi:ribonuclease BN (tRNA processing enzyme)
MMIPEHGIILDAGTGMFRARDLIQTPELHIFLTHAHLDHVVGLTFLLDVTLDRSVDRVFVYCDPAKRSAIVDHLFHPELFPVPPPFEIRDLDGSPVNLPGGGSLHSFPLRHPGGCLGFRLGWPGHCMAYVTDTTADADAAYVGAIAECDLLVHECYFPDGFEQQAEITGHSCLTAVARVAAAARARECWLVHLTPLEETDSFLRLDSVRSVYNNFRIPEDGEIAEF